MAGFPLLLFRVLLVLCLAGPALAAEYHVAAQGTGTQGDGSQAAPFPSIAAALKSGRLMGGDSLLLAPGDYGALEIRGQDFDPPLTITSAPGGRAHVDRIEVRSSHGLIFRGLDVWPRRPKQIKRSLVAAGADAGDIIFEALDIRGGPRALDYFNWTQEDWLKTWRVNGVHLSGPGMVLKDSTITAVANGIGANGTGAQILNNEVRGFSKDGLRGFGEGVVFRGNTVRDCVKVDNNHDDGFQSWTGRGGAPAEVRNITLDGNRIIEWTGAPDHPLRCALQGISMFNGPYRNMVIENNLVLVRAYHGITLYDAIDSRVVNNTVIHVDGKPGKQPWIMQKRDHTADQPPNLFANNLAMAFRLGSKAARAQGNHVIRYPYREFTDPAGYDYRLNQASALRGQSVSGQAPDHDLTGAARGAATDPGAFAGR